MEDVQFGKLESFPVRHAWKDEARHFTPWLADNLDHISDLIGMPLELTGTEVAVDRFSADILARNPEDGSDVLIENQLEATDHRHLGQIMTYLAGLEAKTVIWIAPEFREPHLTAIRWLNEHTADGFSFFAVRLSLFRIGASPYAPMLELVEKPDEFERSIRRKADTEGAAFYDIKEEFWRAFLDAHPEKENLGIKAYRYSANYVRVRKSPNVEVAIWVGRKDCGVYVRSSWGEPSGPLLDLFSPCQTQLENALGAGMGPKGRDDHFFSKRLKIGHDNRDDWSSVIAWLSEELALYSESIGKLLA